MSRASLKRMKHRPRLPVPETLLGLGPFKRGMLWAELRALQQEQQAVVQVERLVGRDPVDHPRAESGHP